MAAFPAVREEQQCQGVFAMRGVADMGLGL